MIHYVLFMSSFGVSLFCIGVLMIRYLHRQEDINPQVYLKED